MTHVSIDIKKPWSYLLAVFFIVGGSLACVSTFASCSALTPVIQTVHEEAFSLDASAVDPVLGAVINRSMDLSYQTDPEAHAALQMAGASLAMYSRIGSYPHTAANEVGLICDIHDLLLETDPTVQGSPYMASWLRSTAILRESFRIAGEPILAPPPE